MEYLGDRESERIIAYKKGIDKVMTLYLMTHGNRYNLCNATPVLKDRHESPYISFNQKIQAKQILLKGRIINSWARTLILFGSSGIFLVGFIYKQISLL